MWTILWGFKLNGGRMKLLSWKLRKLALIWTAITAAGKIITLFCTWGVQRSACGGVNTNPDTFARFFWLSKSAGMSVKTGYTRITIGMWWIHGSKHALDTKFRKSSKAGVVMKCTVELRGSGVNWSESTEQTVVHADGSIFQVDNMVLRDKSFSSGTWNAFALLWVRFAGSYAN